MAALKKNPLQLAKFKHLVRRTAKVEAETALLTGQYIKKDDQEKKDLAKVFAVRGKAQEFPLRAAQIANKSETECERILNEWMKELCNTFAGTHAPAA